MTQTHHRPSSNLHVWWMRGDNAVRLMARGWPSGDVFVSSAWACAAWRHLQQLGSPLVLSVGIESNLWWLPLSDHGDGLRLAGAPLGDRHDLVGPAGPDRERAAVAALQALCEQKAGVHLHAVEPGGALAEALDRDDRWMVEREPSPLIPTGTCRSSGAVRRLHRLRRVGSIEITTRQAHELDASRVRAFTHARRQTWRWRGRETPAVEQLDGFEEFLADAVAPLAAGGRARMWELRMGGRVIAQDLHLGEPERPLLYMRAYDPAWAALSPGRVLLEQVLRILHEEQVGVLDSGRGDESYKMALHGDATVVLNASSSPSGGVDGAS